MKKQIQVLCLSSSMLLIIGCGGGGGGGENTAPAADSNANTNTNTNIVLTKGESMVCAESKTFSVIPKDEPSVQFSKNIENGEVTIKVKENSSGSVTLENCLKV